MIRLSRSEWKRLQSIQQWLEAEKVTTRQVLQVQEHPAIKGVLALLPDDLRTQMLTDVAEKQLTPISHVKWLLAILAREGVEPK